MSEEWRTLPEFPKYEITSDGDVRNKWTKKKLKETENKNTGAWAYSLRKNDGTSTQRNFWGLIHSAWPELAPEPKVEPVKSTRSYSKRGLWKDIPGFPTYQAHPDGLVRYKVSKRFRKIMEDHHGHHVILFNDDGEQRKSIRWVLRHTFPVLEEAV